MKQGRDRRRGRGERVRGGRAMDEKTDTSNRGSTEHSQPNRSLNERGLTCQEEDYVQSSRVYPGTWVRG